jgi:serine/threonine protein kinase
MERMLKKNPKERISAEQSLAHPYFSEMNEK